MVESPRFHFTGRGFSPVWELRCFMLHQFTSVQLHSAAKKKKKIKVMRLDDIRKVLSTVLGML